MNNYDIIGGKVMFVGDLHFSDVYTGKHVAYLVNCNNVLRKITDKIKEAKPRALVLFGDIIGWTETNIKNREVLLMFLRVLKEWNSYCPVYAVRGNHDLKGCPDFLMFEQLGLIRTSTTTGGYFDYYGYDGQEVPEVRFHIVDYSSEFEPLELADGETSNIILGHNNFTIQGQTNWYQEHDGIEVGLQKNFNGVDMILSGHIHNPSPEFVSTTTPDGNVCSLFYLGCPTRPVKEKNMYESCWFAFLEYSDDNKSSDISVERFELEPSEKIFHKDEDFIDERDEEEVAEEIRKEALKEVLEDLLKYRINQGDPAKQIMNIPNASKEAKEMAVQYINSALSE